jgi:hypothetical protein
MAITPEMNSDFGESCREQKKFGEIQILSEFCRKINSNFGKSCRIIGLKVDFQALLLHSSFFRKKRDCHEFLKDKSTQAEHIQTG